MTQNHDTEARLEMLRETIDRNRHKVPEEHVFVEQQATNKKESSSNRQ